MTEEQARELIEGGETLDVEFKGEPRQPLSDNDLVEAVVCLANRPGDKPGYLFLGVEDDGTITGARPRHEGNQTDTGRLQALIANRTQPSYAVRVYSLEIDGLPVTVIEVPPSRSPVGTTGAKYSRRIIGGDSKPACIGYHFHEMQGRQADRGLLDYAALALPEVQWSDLDPLEFERYRRAVRESRGRGDQDLLQLSDLELAKALAAIEANHEVRAVRVLGLLLFGKEEALRTHLPTHEVAFQALSGTRVEANDFFRWPLLRVVEELDARYRAWNREEEVQFGLIRVTVPEYPEKAFREAVANALIHRDYTRTGAVHVQWHTDHLEVTNPGGFPEGVRLDNLLVTQPRPRNPLLADAFKRAGIVDRVGRGIDTIFEQQLRNGRPAPSYDRSTETGVVLVLPGGKANLEFAKLVREESREGRDFTLDHLLLLNHLFQERETHTGDAARVIQKPESDARSHLNWLVEAGLVEARGERKGRSYHLSAMTYQRLGEKAAYTRQRGFESAQQEQMVLNHAERYGRITRKEVAELCRLSPDQASRLLRKLSQSGHLQMHGIRKGAWYERKT